ncbi:MAG: leucyl aminopeptidase [Deltaproteobacteria bacterium]|nr:leucyl aminopeptidase [Deltaproteobacteria bacterium]
MELLFVSPVLSELDGLESEVLACTVWEDVRPCDGVAGLCDWRLAGRVSNLMRRGYLLGQRGEVLLMPGRPNMSFDKILLFGAGPRSAFDEATFREVTAHMMRTIDGLCSRIAVVQLPGRQNDLIPAEKAADALLEAASRPPERRRHDVWTLVEDGRARRRIEQHMIEERRRIRRTE